MITPPNFRKPPAGVGMGLERGPYGTQRGKGLPRSGHDMPVRLNLEERHEEDTYHGWLALSRLQKSKAAGHAIPKPPPLETVRPLPYLGFSPPSRVGGLPRRVLWGSSRKIHRVGSGGAQQVSPRSSSQGQKMGPPEKRIHLRCGLRGWDILGGGGAHGDENHGLRTRGSPARTGGKTAGQSSGLQIISIRWR